MSKATDSDEIKEVLSQYCYYFDHGLADQFAALFTDDCLWESDGFGRHEGAASLRDLCRMANAGAARFRHMVLNTIVRVSGDSARTTSYALVAHVIDGTPVVKSTRFYLDDLVRRNGRWLIAHRRYLSELEPEDLSWSA